MQQLEAATSNPMNCRMEIPQCECLLGRVLVIES